MRLQSLRFRPTLNLLSILALLGTPSVLGQDAPKSHSGSHRHHDEAAVQYRGEPVDLGTGGARVGELIADMELTDLDGRKSRLSEHLGTKGLVIAVRDVGCPLSRKYAPRLAKLEQEYGARGFGFLYFNPNEHDAPADMREEIERYGFKAPYVDDHASVLTRALAARVSTEVFVLDAARTLVYRGAVDDQYGLGFTKPAARRSYLRAALEAVVADDLPGVRATAAPGCYLSSDDPSPGDREITYHNRISRIVQAKCERCHRAGGAGPFALSTYKDLKSRDLTLELVLEDDIMPPFYVDRGYGPWANDFSLNLDERADFLAWLDAGTPEGDAADAALKRRWIDGWTIDLPDYVARTREPFAVPAEGFVDYQYFYVKTDLPEDRWIRQMEIRSTKPQVVHHVLVFLESPELAQQIRARRREVENPWSDPEYRRLRSRFQGGIRGYFASTVPGQSGIIFPEGLGKKLPAGAWLKFQVHYTPNGKAVEDHSEIGFVFADDVEMTEVRTTSAINMDFVIPPGAPSYEVVAKYTFKESAAILSLFPHTHLRGTRFLFEALYPDGREEKLLPLTRYDFNWQLNYLFQEPLEIPAGTVVRATAWYDNSKKNPANPDPTVEVRFGDQTWEEMMIGYINWVPQSTID